ncbi:MAG TPA: 3'(2'),5'-bisphosphate nucleotidase CysQ [Acidimicrobiales bacterium]|nr:3'(2'),5'-bisphosphate nucleotidase CysQ [Acidimicrobiales bacterium]
MSPAADPTADDPTADDHALAAALAEQAGALLMEVRVGARPGSALGDEGDRRSHELLADALTAARPDDGLLSEEGGPARRSGARTWIVDPLDGTREYREGRGDWAVHVALAVRGAAVCGAVALPARGLVCSTAAPPQPPAPSAGPGARPRLVVSRSRAPAWVPDLARALGADVVEMGSAGAKAMAVVLGEADAYVHDGGMHEWDTAAPVAVAAAAGLHVSRLDGATLVYDQEDPWMPDLLVCRPELAAATIAAVGALR